MSDYTQKLQSARQWLFDMDSAVGPFDAEYADELLIQSALDEKQQDSEHLFWYTPEVWKSAKRIYFGERDDNHQ